jgi:ABC-2 type transport system permease protein
MKLLRIAHKDVRLIVRDRAALGFMLLLPILVIVAVAAAESGDNGNILLPVVNEDQGPVAQALIRIFRGHLDVREVDRATAERLVAVENKAPAALVLPAGMSKRYLTEQVSTIELLTDPAAARALLAVKAILLLAEREAASLADPFDEELLDIREHNITGRRLDFSSLEQEIPGFSVMFVLLNLVFSVSFGLRDEHSWGTSTRLAMAPVSPAVVLGGKLLARVVVGTLQLLILLGFGHVVYGVMLGRSAVTLVLVAAIVVFAMACFSVIVAALARSREQVVPVGLSAVFILAALGGCWWPFFDQPKWMQVLAHGAVTTWSMFAIQDVILRERDLSAVAPTLLLLIAFGLVSFAAGCWLFRNREGAPR